MNDNKLREARTPYVINAVYEDGVLRPLEKVELGEHQRVSLHIMPPDVRIPAVVARRRVTRFVLDHVSYLMHGGSPTLIGTDHPYWRVPVILTLPTHGVVGPVGTIDVDAATGELQIFPDLIEEITSNAEKLVAGLSPHSNSTR